MLLLKSDGRRREKLGILWLGVGHGRATTGTGRAKLLELWVFSKAWAGTAVPSFWHLRLKIFFLRFLESVSDNFLQNNLKQTKSD